MDLTQGNITGKLIKFALPLMLGNILQQCYNIADTLIVGRYVGNDALAAVGASYTLMIFLTSIILGLSMGAGAFISMEFGKKDYDRMKNGIVLAFVLIGSITLLITFVFFAENNNIIKLPFKIPKYKTYSINTAINGILEAYGNDEVWLYNNYISLWIYAKRERKEYMVDFKYDRDVNYYEQCPMLETVILNVRKNQNVNNIIKNSIDNKEYIFLAVDMYFIDSWWKDIEKKKHSEHEMLIWGYDNEKKVFFTADFFKHTYSIQEISYLDFRMAFDAHAGYIRERDNVNSVEIRTFKYLKNKKYALNVDRIRNMITDFIKSRENTINDESDLFTVHEAVLYGFECLNHIIEYFNECVCKHERLDFRIIHLIYIFNEIMYCRIDYMIEHKYLSDNTYIRNIQNDFHDMSHKNEMLRSLVMKYNLIKGQKYGEIVIKKMKDLFWQLENSLEKLNIYFENI